MSNPYEEHMEAIDLAVDEAKRTQEMLGTLSVQVDKLFAAVVSATGENPRANGPREALEHARALAEGVRELMAHPAVIDQQMSDYRGYF